MSSYIEFNTPPSMTYSRTVPVAPAFMMKSLFTDNSKVVYKPGSLAAGGVGTVKNTRHKSRFI
uniref:Uncharacterized protein n=1 Tax=viral metagenome TaxID=1070528 RepID=A0A6C0HI12_9ZZZZ